MLPPQLGHFVTTTKNLKSFDNLNLMNSFPYLCTLINTFIIIKNMLCVHSYQEMTPAGGNGTTCPVATKIKFHILWWKLNIDLYIF